MYISITYLSTCNAVPCPVMRSILTFFYLLFPLSSSLSCDTINVRKCSIILIPSVIFNFDISPSYYLNTFMWFKSTHTTPTLSGYNLLYIIKMQKDSCCMLHEKTILREKYYILSVYYFIRNYFNVFICVCLSWYYFNLFFQNFYLCSQ